MDLSNDWFNKFFFFFWVVIEGVRGNGYYGDIVIDDVFFISGCKLIIGFFL